MKHDPNHPYTLTSDERIALAARFRGAASLLESGEPHEGLWRPLMTAPEPVEMAYREGDRCNNPRCWHFREEHTRRHTIYLGDGETLESTQANACARGACSCEAWVAVPGRAQP